ncbi:hypothetical protein JW865_07765 [Candidatus Bathyarchaeota archaeon]|nr:hypothetical protein [Candidatus Bathyarchaeota archaeon]
MNNKIDIVSLFNEINQIFKKYNMPKMIGFIPDKINIFLERENNSSFSLIYEEFFTYLPKELLDLSRKNAIELLTKVGIPSEKITSLDKGIQVKITGDAKIIQFPILELILQDKKINKNSKSFCEDLIKSINNISEFYELIYSTNIEESISLVDYIEDISNNIEKKPEIQQEIEKIVKKYYNQNNM